MLIEYLVLGYLDTRYFMVIRARSGGDSERRGDVDNNGYPSEGEG